MSKRTGNSYGAYTGVHRPGGPRKARSPRDLVAKPYIRTKLVSSVADVKAHRVSPNGSVFDQDLDTFCTTIGTNKFVGTTNPFWRDQVRNGVSATTTASGSRFDFRNVWLTGEKVMYNSITPGTTKVEMWGHPTLYVGSGGPPDGTTQSKVDDRAKRKFLNQLDQILSSVEVGQDLGEYKETVHGILSPLKSLKHQTLSYLDKLTKIRPSFKRDKPGLLKALADTYLEWTFGWKPLALDIADAMVGLQNRGQHFNSVPISAGSREYYQGSTAQNGVNVDSASFLRQGSRTRSQCSYTVRYKGSVKVELVRGSLPISQVLQFDLPHFVPTVWDLIPYSFVVDYFTNVGDVIRAYSARTQSLSWVVQTTRTVYRSDIYAYIEDTKGQVGVPWSPVALREDGQNAWIEQTDFTRVNYSPAALNSMAFHFEMPSSEKPWENIAALLISRIRPLVPLFRP